MKFRRRVPLVGVTLLFTGILLTACAQAPVSREEASSMGAKQALPPAATQDPTQTPEVDEPELSDSGVSAAYLFPDSDRRYLEDADVRYSTPHDLRLGRNEIFARHGLIFESRDLDRHFRSKSWYSPTVSAADLHIIRLNGFEKQNVRTFQSVEQDWKSLSNGGPFIGVKGLYNRSSDESDLAVINITAIDSSFLTLDILGGSSDEVYFKGLKARIVDENEATVTLGPGGAVVALHWLNPGTMEVKKTSGELPVTLRDLLDPPEYWNSGYLHTN